MSEIEEKPCPICVGKVIPFKEISNFRLVRCEACNLVNARSVSPTIDLTSFYSESYFKAEKGTTLGYFDYLADEHNHRSNARDIFRLVKRHRKLEGTRVLDIGCAKGLLLDEIKLRYHCDIQGLELSATAADYARNTLKLPVHTDNLDPARYGKEVFDFVFLIGTIEHLENPVEIVKSSFEVLKSGGVMVITTIDTKGIFPFYSYKPPEHLFYFDHNNLKLLASKAGFQILSLKMFRVRYMLHDVFDRLAAFFSFGFLHSIGNLFRRTVPNLSIKIPTNEMILVLRKP